MGVDFTLPSSANIYPHPHALKVAQFDSQYAPTVELLSHVIIRWLS